MITRNRKEWLKENRKLLVKVLEHITNVTNLGLNLKEENNHLIITYPGPHIRKSNQETAEINKAGLVFSQDPNNGMKVKHQLPFRGEELKEEVVAQVPASAVNEQFIYEQVIEFLEKVKTAGS